VMKTDNEGDHFRETKKIYDYAYNNFVKEKIDLNKYAEELPIENGKKTDIKVHFNDKINLPINKNIKQDYEIDYQLSNHKEILESARDKDKVNGTANIRKKTADKYDYLLPECADKQEVNVYATEEVDKKSYFSKLKQAFFSLFS